MVAENVPGFRRSDIFSMFIGRLESSGYTTSWRKLKAKNFKIPQRRERIFIVGMKGFTGDKDSLLPENPPIASSELVTVREAIGDLPELTNNHNGSSVSKYRRGRPTSFQSSMRGYSGILYDHVAHCVHPTVAERFQYIPQGYNLRKTWVEGRIPESSMKSEYVLRGTVRKGFSEKTLGNMHSNIYRRL